ncbi:MAG: hypothetical protein ACTS6P_00295 [Candidatus Hodgkinia cicadicola]
MSLVSNLASCVHYKVIVNGPWIAARSQHRKMTFLPSFVNPLICFFVRLWDAN